MLFQYSSKVGIVKHFSDILFELFKASRAP